MNATRRAPIKAVNIPAAAVAKQAAAESARKAASKKALKASKPQPAPEPVKPQHDRRVDPDASAARAAEYAANALKSAQEDAALTGLPLEQILADMGLDATGHPLPNHKAGTERPTYTGPMLILRERSKSGAYVKAANGNPCCSDRLAVLCGAHHREIIVKALIRALKLDFNPYAHLNPGQQSMNLRNKTRAAIKNGLLRIEDVEAAFKEA